MRIIAGRLGGRQFSSPKGYRTHPMSDKGRGALFNVLGDVTGLNVLDAFGGSGALSLEAISRGAAKATILERDRQAQITIQQNIQHLGLNDTVKLVKAAANAWLQTTKATYDLVLLDPPFEDLQLPLLQKLAARTSLGGVAVFSLPPNVKLDLTHSFEFLTTKTYGDNQLVFYRRFKVK